MTITQQLLRRDVKRTIRNVTAQVNGFPTIAGSTATDGSQTVRKLARAPPSGHKINEDSKGRSRPAEFNGDSESPAARTNSIETAGTEGPNSSFEHPEGSRMAEFNGDSQKEALLLNNRTLKF